jgi:uncharacterized protein YwqG
MDYLGALFHPDQHCPRLAEERTISDKESKLGYLPFLERTFRYPTSDDWAPNFPG